MAGQAYGFSSFGSQLVHSARYSSWWQSAASSCKGVKASDYILLIIKIYYL